MRKPTKNPSRKGAANERAIARELSLWYYRDPKVLIRRAHAGIERPPDPRWVHLDDVWQIDRYDDPFPFAVQMKHYKDPVELQHIFQPNSQFRQAWDQTLRFIAGMPEDAHQWALLSYRVNNRPPFAVLHEAVACALPQLRIIPSLLFAGVDEQPARILPWQALLDLDARNVRDIWTSPPVE